MSFLSACFQDFVFCFQKFTYDAPRHGFLLSLSFLEITQLFDSVSVCLPRFGKFSAIFLEILLQFHPLFSPETIII